MLTKKGEQKNGNEAANKDNIIKDLEKQVEDYKSKLVYSYAERENIRRMSKEETDRVNYFLILNLIILCRSEILVFLPLPSKSSM
jgi:molecular chaperone GrpE (heat shock protein)